MSERSRARLAAVITGAVTDWAQKHGMSKMALDRVSGDILMLRVVMPCAFTNELTSPLASVVFNLERNIRHWDELPGLGDPVQDVHAELDTKLQEWVVYGAVNAEAKP